MKLICSFVLLFVTLNNSFSQVNQDDYKKFMAAFEKANYQKATKMAPALIQKLQESDSLYMEVCSYNAYAWFGLKQYDSAVYYCSREVDARNKYQPNEYINLSNAHYFLSIYYSYKAQYAPAILNMITSRNHILEPYGEKHLTVIHMTNQLANLYNLAGNTKDAEILYEKNYELVKNNFKNTDSIYQVMANAISAFYTGNGIYDKAEPFFFDALNILEKAYGKKSQNYLMSMNSFGEFYLYAGNYKRAIEIYKDFEILCGEFYGKKSADYATALNNLAVSYEKSGDYTEAEKLYLKSLSIKEKVYTKKSNFYALTLINLGVVYDYLGQYNKAEKMLEDAISIYREINGERSENYATALSNISSVYSANGKYKEAIAVLQKSMEIYKSIYGENSIGYITSLNNIANIHDNTGEYDLAEKEFELVISLREKAQGKTHADLAVSLSSLASIKSLRGKASEAEALLQRALSIAEYNFSKQHVSYANILHQLANFYVSNGKYNQAEETYQECRLIYNRVLGPMHPEFAVFLNNCGQFHLERGEINRATEELNKAMVIQTACYGADHPMNISLLSNLANLKVAQGEFQEAEKLISSAIQIGKKYYGTEQPDYGTLLNNAAVLYYEIGNLSYAEELYNEAIIVRKKVYGEKHPEYGVSLNNLASLLLAKATQEKDVEKYHTYINSAIHYFNEALQIDSISSNNENPAFAHHYNNLGEAYRLKNEAEKAIFYFNQSVEYENKYYPEHKKSIAVSYHNLALVYTGLKNYSQAKDYALKSLQLFEEQFGKDCFAAASVTSSLAYLFEMEENIQEALLYYQKAIRINSNELDRNFAFLSETEKAEYLNSVELYHDMFATFVLKNHTKNPELVTLLYDEEIKRKGILLRSSGNLKSQVIAKNDKALLKTYTQWINLREYLGQQYALELKDRSTEIDSLEKEANQLEKTLVAAVGTYKTENSSSSSCKKTIENLVTGQAAIEYISFMKNDEAKETVYCAILLLPGQKNPELFELFTEIQITEILGNNPGSNYNYISSVYGKKNDPTSKIAPLVINPLLAKLGNTTQLFYSPAGILNRLSFAAIKIGENKFLSDRFKLAQLSSTSTTHAFKKMPVYNHKGEVVLFGGINYGKEKGDWNYLPATLTEAEKIKTILATSAAKIVYEVGESASEEKIKSVIKNSSPSIIHIATHGFFFGDVSTDLKNKASEVASVDFRGAAGNAQSAVLNKNPMLRSGLILAGANNSTEKDTSKNEDGVLTAYEVALLNLSKTQLVVLSACETGLGDIKGSEGVYGLQRAFKMAGAQTLIMSLWQVPDKETEEFMTTFYSLLVKNNNIRMAFTGTQEMMRKKYDPYYWAAFVLIE